jgi:oligopeptide transport system substrate-binding protein
VLGELARQKPLLLLLDNLHWADEGSLRLLEHLVSAIKGRPVLVIGAFRPEEISTGRTLETIYHQFQREFGEITVHLGEESNLGFVDAYLDSESNRLERAFRDRLHNLSRGHPLFTVELLRAMQARGELVQDRQGRWFQGAPIDWKILPHQVEAVIAERLSQLPERLHMLLQVACIEGGTFRAELLANVLESSEVEIIQQLGTELDRIHHLVKLEDIQQIDGRRLSIYRFRHILFQKYLYGCLDRAEKTYLHAAVARELEALYTGQSEAQSTIAGELARHYQQAGEVEKSIHYLLQAGDRSRILYALQDATDYYEQALVQLRERRDYSRAARTLMKLGLTHNAAFQFQQAQKAYEDGFYLWQQTSRSLQSKPLSISPQTFRTRWPEPKTLDSAKNTYTVTTTFISQLFSGLVELSPAMEIIPDVARNWEISRDGRQYIFHLREDVFWNDGAPVTATDFEYAFKWHLNPATKSDYAHLLYGIIGAREYHQGVVSQGEIGVHAPDDITLIINLETPSSFFLYFLSHYIYPMPHHKVTEHGASWAEPENIVVNGPFVLDTWKRGQSMTLVRNPRYHGCFSGNLQRVELVVPWETMLERYESDTLDAIPITHLSLADFDYIRHQYSNEYLSLPQLATDSIGINLRRQPFDDVHVRMAFAMAVDKQGLNTIAGDRFYSLTGGIVPPGLPGHVPGIALSYDPAQAQRLLKDAGFPDGHGFPPIELWMPENPLSTIVADYLTKQWSENLRIDIRWEPNIPWMHQAPEETWPHLFYVGWSADYPDPDSCLRIGIHRARTGWQNQAYNQLIEKANISMEQEERLELYAKAEKILVEEMPIIPMAYGREHFLVKPWVESLPIIGTKGPSWKDVIIKPHP